jgi:hypothetical protein
MITINSYDKIPVLVAILKLCLGVHGCTRGGTAKKCAYRLMVKVLKGVATNCSRVFKTEE